MKKYIVVSCGIIVFWSESHTECKEFISMNEKMQPPGCCDFEIYELCKAD